MSSRIRHLWPALAAVAFLGLFAAVIGDAEPVRRLDQQISGRFRAYGLANQGVIAGIRVATDVMGTYAFLTVGAAATILLWRDRRRAAMFCAAVTALVPTLWGVLHALLHRPRPADAFVDIQSNGFPSGHTSHATATALVAVSLLWPRLGRTGRVAAVTAGILFAATIGLTRVMLLAHWPSDVLGGWLLGAAVVPTLAWVFSLGLRTDQQGEAGEADGDQHGDSTVE